MEFNRHTTSVIARLMGFDEPLSPQPAYKQRRILSENYLQKTASIGLREKSSIFVGRSSSMNTKKRKAIKDSFAFTLPKFKETAYSINEGNSIPDISSVEMQIDDAVVEQNSGESDKLLGDLCSNKDNLPSYVQQANNQSDYCLRHSAVSMSSCASKYRNNGVCKKSDIVTKGNIWGLIQELETDSAVGSICNLNAQPGYAVCKKYKFTSCDLKHGWKSRHSRTFLRPDTSQICSFVSGIAKSRTTTESSQYGSYLWQTNDVRNENKCKRQRQKHYVVIGDAKVVIPERKSASRFYRCNPGLSNSLSKSLASTRNAAGLIANANTESTGIPFMNFDSLHSEPTPCSFSSGDDLSSYSWKASVRQESSNESPQNRLVSLKDTIIDSNSPMNLKETNQSSPNSVLEPHFKERKLPNSECFESHVVDLHSVVRQLKFIETNSEETYSEGSEMAVSSVGNTEKGSFYFSQEVLGVFSTEESRDFSYLVDVLDEAQLNFEVDFETCNSLESPINPLLFEALEKKYGKQISWLKSERRFLFDRINSRLSEILNSFTDIHIRARSLKTRFHPMLRRSEVEEELWTFLVNEEKEVGKDLSEKALGMETNWLKMEREISIICKEVENHLFDELAAELYCT